MLKLIEKKHYALYNKIDNIKKGNVKHYLPLINEWNNSVYNYNNKIIKNLNIKDTYIYKLLDSYFNLKKIKSSKKKFSITKVFIGKQYIHHINNKIYITLCIFNKENIYLKNMYNKLYIKILFNRWLKKRRKDIEKKTTLKRFNFIPKNIKKQKTNINLLLNYNKYKILIKIYLLKKYKKLFISFLYKKSIKLKFINYKYNINNFLGIKNILYKIYNKEVEFNIINLKYLYLDSNILNEAIGAKLKNRKANLLKNIIKSIALVKIPNIKSYNNLNYYNFDLGNILLFLNPNLYIKDVGSINDSIYASTQKLSIALYNLKYKTITGIKVEGAGRLTKRLTALRSVSKIKQKGTLKNIYSSYNKLSSIILLGYLKSNLQYIKKNYNNRNGSYGIKTHISSY